MLSSDTYAVELRKKKTSTKAELKAMIFVEEANCKSFKGSAKPQVYTPIIE